MDKKLDKNPYDQFARFYDKSTNLEVFNTYVSIIGNKIKDKNILDLGCGTGNLLTFYSANNKTFGIDGSRE